MPIVSTDISSNINLNSNELKLAVLQPLAADPAPPTYPAPKVGQMYFNTLTKKIRTYNGSTWDETGTSSGTGDVIGPVSSADNQVVLFNLTTGKLIKALTLNADVLKSTNGVLSAATPGTDYLTPTGDGSQLTGITPSQVGSPSGSGTSTGTNTGDNAVNNLYANLVNGLEQYTNVASFPITGSLKTVYLDQTTRFPYYWNGSAYKKIGSFSTDLSVSLPGVKTFGRYGNGATISATDKLPSEVIQMALVEPISPTVSLTSGTTISFNQTAISNVLNFSYTINSLGASVSTVSLEWKRSSSGTWNVLSTNTGLTTFTHNFTDSAYNADEFDYRYVVTDSAGATATATLTINTAAYVAPTISFSVGSTTRELGNTTTSITGTITRNSSLVLLTSYQVYRSVNGGTYTAIGSPVSISGASASISVTDSDPSIVLNTTLTVGYQVRVIDGFQTTTSSNTTISFVYKSVLGYDTDPTVTIGEINAMGNSSLTNANNRTVSGVTASGGNYTYYCYNSTANDLNTVYLDGVDSILGAFTKLSNVTGNNSYGVQVTYKVYRSNSTNAFTNNSLAFA